jgi:hypothetical protein
VIPRRTTKDPLPPHPYRSPLLYVPIRPGSQWLVVRWFQTRLGEPTAVGFTSPAKLTAVLGEAQAWMTLCERALRDLAAQQGITALTVDPTLAAPSVGSARTVAATWDPQVMQASSPARSTHAA